eukprot:SM000001S04422  [mRNA]  locus=s1:144822:147069:+ [translate_table: standard]
MSCWRYRGALPPNAGPASLAGIRGSRQSKPMFWFSRWQRVSGGIILAPEGINGSVCGTRDGVDAMLAALRADLRLENMRHTEVPAAAEGGGAAHLAEHGHTPRSPLGAGVDAPFRWDHVRVKLKKEVRQGCSRQPPAAARLARASGQPVEELCRSSATSLVDDWGCPDRVQSVSNVVPMGVGGLNPLARAGVYVKPCDWNELISDPNTVVGCSGLGRLPSLLALRMFDLIVIDVRNAYETRIGSFHRALEPKTDSFRQFPQWVESTLLGQMQGGGDASTLASSMWRSHVDITQATRGASDGNEGAAACAGSKAPRIAMYCTGGIRCEKATAYMLEKGFEEVYHLEGGILKYLQEVPASESLWQGECFVFDKRVSVGHSLAPGTFRLCYACQQPVRHATSPQALLECSAKDMASSQWEVGVSCPHCFGTRSEAERARARARQEQVKVWGRVGGPDRGRRHKVTQEAQEERLCQVGPL